MQKNNKIKRSKKTIIIAFIGFIVYYLLLAFLGILLYKNVMSYVNDFIDERLKNINYVDIDKENLDINTEVVDNNIISEEEFTEIKTIAIFGSDSRNVNDMSSGRADSIMIVSINPNIKSIKLVSIPRDTYVNIPGYGYDKINHAYAFGKEELLLKTINNNFGLNITEYITIDFLGLVNIVNSIGGVELNISEDEMGIINKYLREIYALEGMPFQEMTVCGNVILNGEQAVAHCRNRYIGSDFTRARRQRDIITAIINKMSVMDKEKILEVIDLSLTNVQTNINIKEYLTEIISVILNLSQYKQNIISAQVPSLEYGYGQYINGIYYFTCDLNRAKQDIWAYIYEK